MRYEDRLLAGVLKSMSPCTFEQTVNDVSDTLSVMELQHIKMTVGLWAVTAVVIAITTDLSWTGSIASVAFGLLPLLAIVLLWNDPAHTMRVRIREARR